MRYIDTDLNRVFPGDPDAEAYEDRLAHDLLTELQGCQVLALHSTQSTPRPFAIVSEVAPLAETICPHLSLAALVEAGCVDTALGAYVDAIEVECGLQGTEQACENAERLVREFLGVVGALPAPPSRTSSVPVYRLRAPISKPPASEYAVHAQNFEQVNKGETYATVDDLALIAEEPFYPVLLSAAGYSRPTVTRRLDRLAAAECIEYVHEPTALWRLVEDPRAEPEQEEVEKQ